MIKTNHLTIHTHKSHQLYTIHQSYQEYISVSFRPSNIYISIINLRASWTVGAKLSESVKGYINQSHDALMIENKL